MSASPDDIIGLYQRFARRFDEVRGRYLMERRWLDAFLNLIPAGGIILDLGCGSGEPIARHIVDRGYKVTGVDSAPAMLAMCRERFADHSWIEADMRRLGLRARFDGIIAWDSFFHLSGTDQRAMFPIFRAHAAARAALMFTSGPVAGIAIGDLFGEPLFHDSLDPQDYRRLLEENGFSVVDYVAEDPDCGGHTIWLAQSIGTESAGT
ncbi:SAM-dependent methyltransferase [Rhodobium orientis]|uniref:SAM-dependent methyltransferase n=1 Tax=Rhodobium orientis TaxID=34017 RepID=A0A327JL36_9HYPH|nr:class I SAM-dependent methyltransferase [Rhodobium orientis]MBB4302017.1 SAM-dependent methyltransferase [Rhodobium orientis]MBK5950254.1 SAM-dependent methyltransferase [Rhodobium orientis]RAI27150.1 SAM-dependent methyltransferase [Rhodobium orientis]